MKKIKWLLVFMLLTTTALCVLWLMAKYVLWIFTAIIAALSTTVILAGIILLTEWIVGDDDG